MGTIHQPLIYLNEWREARHLTQRQLSRLTGLNPTTISKLGLRKHGPLPDTRRKLAEALGIEPDQLLSPPPATVDRERRNWLRRAMALEDGVTIQFAIVIADGGEFRALLSETPEEAERLALDSQERGQRAWPVVLEGDGEVVRR